MLRKTDLPASPTPQWASLAHVLSERARRHPLRPALTFIADDGNEQTLTYAGLENRVIEVASRLMRSHEDSGGGDKTRAEEPLVAGDRVLLLFPPGLEFTVGFLACQYCRLIPVPTCFPKPGRAMPRLDAAASDCAPKVLLADAETLPGIDPNRVAPQVSRLRYVATDAGRPASHRIDVSGTHSHDWTGESSLALSHAEFDTTKSFNALWRPEISQVLGDDLGLLQYTSGSTSQPKGVMVSNANLLSNLESIRQAFGLQRSDGEADEYSRGVFWLPPFHDMGLIGGILEAVYIGGHTVLMSPRSFLARPLRWLEAISRTGASISGAPNFAYQLCVDRIEPDRVAGLDLSNWDVAFCGAEPISADTLQRFCKHFAAAGFRSEAFIPCYGLAEATLLAASGHSTPDLPTITVDRDDLLLGHATPVASSEDRPTRRLVGCGEPGADMTIEIVDPETRVRKPHGDIGEIWLQGQSVAQGYWQRPEINAEQFHAMIVDEESRGGFLRTGDLGFFHAGNLYVTGRCKDVIILRGRNHFPQDLEQTVRETLGDQFVNAVAVASSGNHGDSLSLVIEVSRHMSEDLMPDVVRQIRRRIIEEHEVDARQVLLTRPGTIPLTTSGKVQRQACRKLLDEGQISAKFRWSRSVLTEDAAAMPPLPQRSDIDSIEDAAAQIETWLMAWLVARGGVDQADVHPDTPFADHGLDSLAAVELSGELEDWLGVELTPVLAWNYPTPARLATFLAEELAGGGEEDQDSVADDENDFERLLAEIEQMPED